MYSMPEFVVDGCNLKSPGRYKMTDNDLNQLALKAVEKYLASADEEITNRHLPYLRRNVYYRIPDCIRERSEELV